MRTLSLLLTLSLLSKYWIFFSGLVLDPNRCFLHFFLQEGLILSSSFISQGLLTISVSSQTFFLGLDFQLCQNDILAWMSLKASQIKRDQDTVPVPSVLASLLHSVQMPVILISPNTAIIYLLSGLNQKTWSRSWQFTLPRHPSPSPTVSNHYPVLILNSKIGVRSTPFSLVETWSAPLLGHRHLLLNCCSGPTPLPLPGCSPPRLLRAHLPLLSLFPLLSASPLTVASDSFPTSLPTCPSVSFPPFLC